MAPVSQLLVYYVTPQGEPVSDVISFDVKLLQKQVYVSVEEKEFWYPNQALDVEIVAEHSSLVCLIGGRSGTGNDVRFDPRISDERVPSGILTDELDFLEAGVSLFQRQCVRRADSDVYAISYRQRGSGAGPANRRRPQESLVGGEPFDMLWLWKCFNYTSEIAASGMTLSAPDESGRWSLWALTLASSGLRFSTPVSVAVFRPLQAEFRLPPSLRVGETLEVDVKIGNNINTCMDVTALLALSEGAQFLTNGLLYVTERLRLGPHGATSLVVRILVSTPGLKNMTVEVNGYSSSSCDVGGAANYSNESLSGAVVRSATLLVQPEGLVRTDTESAYFCANENIVISSAEDFRYEWLGAPRNRGLLVFEVRAPGAVHLALSDTRQSTDHMYQVAIGDSGNSVTWLGRGKHEYGVQLASAPTVNALSADHWQTFWISWERNTISFGNGAIPYNRTLLKWKMDRKMKIQNIGFASLWGIAAQFRIWNYNDEAGFSQVLHLDIPRSVVPGSESGTLLVTGGLALPSAEHLEQHSSSLQGAIAALTPLLLLEHLGLSGNKTVQHSALSNLPGQVQNVLSFRNADNSFSEHHLLSSHSATLSALEALVKVQTFFGVDPDLVQEIKRWIQQRQEDDGSFLPLPADFKITDENVTPKTSNLTPQFLNFERTIEMTAETVIVLHEVGIESEVDTEVIGRVQKYLESNVHNTRTCSSISAVAVALVLLHSSKAQTAMDILKNYSTTEEGDFGWPHPIPKRDAADWLYESETGKTLKEPIPTTAEDFRASLNSLTAFCLVRDMKSAESVARYLFYRSHMLDRHTDLVYRSVKAFSKFSALAYDQHRALTVSLATSGMELTDTLELRNENADQILHLPSLPTKIFVYATGAGCATIQGHTSYSTYAANNQTPLLDIWSKVADEIIPDRSSVEEIEGKLPMLKIKTCYRWKSSSPSGVLRLEISLFSGYELFSVSPLVNDVDDLQVNLQHGSQDNNLWFVFPNVTTNCPICVQYVIRSSYVISSLRPAFARVYPATREDLAAETFFHCHHGSELLSGITEDDLITWFGKNETTRNVSDFGHVGGCEQTTSSTTPEPTTTEATATTTTLTAATTDKMENVVTSTASLMPDDLSVTTYTINVDRPNATVKLDSNNTTSTKPEYNITKIVYKNNTIVQTNSVPKENTNSTAKKLLIVKYKKVLDTLTKQKPNIETKQVNITINNTLNNQNVNISKPSKLKSFLKTKLKYVINLNKTNSKNASENLKPNAVTVKELHSSLAETKLNSISHDAKHVNKEIQEIPLEYLDESKISEDTPPTILPESKDKYLVLDKDMLWGMLKEVVHDELDKSEKSKKEEIKILRSQNLT